MSARNRFLALSLLFLLLVGCNAPSRRPPTDLTPTSRPTVDLSQAKAILVILRAYSHPMGQMQISAAIPLFFLVDEAAPESKTIISGTGQGIAMLNGTATGSGGSYTVSAEWPVEYDVRGSFNPSRSQCELILTIDEVLLLSREVMLHTSSLGDIPMVGGVDEFTQFKDLQFVETEPEVTIISGAGMESIFTIEEWCIPNAWCTYACPVP